MVSKTDKEAPIADQAPDGVALSDAEKKAAMKEGAKEDAKETGKAIHHAMTDGVEIGDAPTNKYLGHDDVQQYADILELGVDEFERVASGKSDREVPEEKLYGLLGMERNGKNRTPYVKALMKRLGLKKDELPGGGPDYTNDVTPTSKL